MLRILYKAPSRSLMVLLVTTLLLPCLAHAQTLGAVFLIEANSPEGLLACSASLIKVDGTCAMVTNRHCAIQADDTVSLITDHDTQIPAGMLVLFGLHPEGKDPANVTTVKVLKKDGVYELAQLEVPEAIEKAYCPLIQEAGDGENQREGVDGIKHADSFASLAYLAGKPVVHYVDDMPWEQAQAPTETKFVQTGLDDYAVLLQASGLEIIPGMSGGLVINARKKVVGVNAQFIQFQDTGFIVPLATIAHFLKASTRMHESGDINKHAVSATHIASLNAAANAGANGHGNSGGNGHGNSGGLIDSRFDVAEPLTLFREPDEGIPDPTNAGQLILGVGPSQIDGIDDFRMHPPTGADRVVSRPLNSYPNESVRASLLNRLDGFYWMSQQSTDDRHILYIKNPDSPLGWSIAVQGRSALEIDVNSSKKQIYVTISQNYLTPRGKPLELSASPSSSLLYSYVPSGDSKTIQLKLPGGKIVLCDNRHYLKLICSGEDSEFSLSRSELTGEIKYRLTQKLSLGGKEYIDYQFGTLQPAHSKKSTQKFRESRDHEP